MFNNDGTSKFTAGQNPILDSVREKQNFNVHYKSKEGKDDKGEKEKFKFMSDNYDGFLDQLKKEKEASKEKQKKVHGDKQFNAYKGK